MPEISKRKLESYKRAELVAREVRSQIGTPNYGKWDQNLIASYVINWMEVTGSIKFEKPKISDMKCTRMRKQHQQ